MLRPYARKLGLEASRHNIVACIRTRNTALGADNLQTVKSSTTLGSF